AYGPDPADPTNVYSGTTMLEVLDIVNQQQLGNFDLSVDGAGAIRPIAHAVDWQYYGRITYQRPDGSNLVILDNTQGKNYLDPTIIDQIKNITASGGGFIRLPGSNVNLTTSLDRGSELAAKLNTGGFSIYLGQNFCYLCINHAELEAIISWIVNLYDTANHNIPGLQTVVEGFSYTGPVAMHASVDCSTCETILEAPVAVPLDLDPYHNVDQFRQDQLNSNHTTLIKIGLYDAVPVIFGSVSYSYPINGSYYQWGYDINMDIYSNNPFISVDTCGPIGHDGTLLGNC
ncbi:MAG: hypothetical protein P8173_16375, partial [Gammaproteobacteria bacterium]